MTLRDVLAESYDIYVKEQEYFCVPKYGAIVDETTYEMRSAAELDLKVDRNNGRETNRWNIMTMTTAIGTFATTDSVTMYNNSISGADT